MADALNVVRPEQDEASFGVRREVKEAAKPEGVRRGFNHLKRQLFTYDYTQGVRKGGFDVGITRADRMSDAEAADMLHRIHASYGVAKSAEGFLYDFDRAFFLCYAFNGASQLLDADRVTFTVYGEKHGTYDYTTASKLMGIASRRFFRAYADHIVTLCRNLYDNVNPESFHMTYLREQMVALADVRGITRFPWLVADCAEAALDLSAAERAGVAAAKQANIGKSYNAVDKRNLAQPVQSLDSYDSSNGESVVNAVQPLSKGMGGPVYTR